MGAAPGPHGQNNRDYPAAESAPLTMPPTPPPGVSLNPVVQVVGVLSGDPLPTPTPAPTPTPTPYESVGGETATPTSNVTAPPTSVAANFFGPASSVPSLALLFGLVLGFAGFAYVRRERDRIKVPFHQGRS